MAEKCEVCGSEIKVEGGLVVCSKCDTRPRRQKRDPRLIQTRQKKQDAVVTSSAKPVFKSVKELRAEVRVNAPPPLYAVYEQVRAERERRRASSAHRR